jgi:hypothetical protein
MNDDDKLQKLLRLKRYEQPPEEFAEEFLEKFQRRQRGELMRRSALGLLWERLQAWAEGLRRPVVLWSAAGVYAALMLGLWLWPRPAPQSSTTMLVSTTEPGLNTQQVSTNPGGVQINHNVGVPGKRRTPGQDQDKERVIGPESGEQPGNAPGRPLRDF